MKSQFSSMEKHPQLLLLRHGKSDWNQKSRFTGWVDVPLSKEGIAEAQRAGQALSKIPIDAIFVSSLIRSQMTAMLAMVEHSSDKTPILFHQGEPKLEEWGKIYDPHAQMDVIPVYEAWQLNERMYGQLQGLNKERTAAQFGEEQVKIWRRSYEVPPPDGESLEMTAQRCLPYFKERIAPLLEGGKTVLVSAHGNSLRSIAMHLEGLSRKEVLSLEIPTGTFLCYAFLGNGCWRKER